MVMVNLLKLSQDSLTWAPSPCLREMFMEQAKKGQLQDTAVAQPVETPAPREASGLCWHFVWFGNCKPSKPWTAEKTLLWLRGTEIVAFLVWLWSSRLTILLFQAFWRLKECSQGNMSIFAYRSKQDPCSSHMAVEHHS